MALVLVFISDGEGYHAIGSAPICMAAGAMLFDRWLACGLIRLKVASFAAAAAVSGTLIALLTLPILPIAIYAKTSRPSAVPDTANEIG